MKAIAVYDRQPLIVGDRSYPHVWLIADSAIGRDVMPLFVPDIPVRWTASVCLAVRIQRLGKCIAEKFALRYVDAIGTVCLLTPDPDDPLGASLADCGAASILDSAVTTGHWIECDAHTVTSIDMEVCGRHYTYDASDLDIPRHISEVSRLATVKTGDIIILMCTAAPVSLERDTHITASIDGTPTLDLKVK